MGLAPDPIDRSRALSTRPVPTLAASEQPTERLVPESRLREPGTGKEIVIPPHYERPSPFLIATRKKIMKPSTKDEAAGKAHEVKGTVKFRKRSAR